MALFEGIWDVGPSQPRYFDQSANASPVITTDQTGTVTLTADARANITYLNVVVNQISSSAGSTPGYTITITKGGTNLGSYNIPAPSGSDIIFNQTINTPFYLNKNETVTLSCFGTWPGGGQVTLGLNLSVLGEYL